MSGVIPAWLAVRRNRFLLLGIVAVVAWGGHFGLSWAFQRVESQTISETLELMAAVPNRVEFHPGMRSDTFAVSENGRQVQVKVPSNSIATLFIAEIGQSCGQTGMAAFTSDGKVLDWQWAPHFIKTFGPGDYWLVLTVPTSMAELFTVAVFDEGDGCGVLRRFTATPLPRGSWHRLLYADAFRRDGSSWVGGKTLGGWPPGITKLIIDPAALPRMVIREMKEIRK